MTSILCIDDRLINNTRIKNIFDALHELCINNNICDTKLIVSKYRNLDLAFKIDQLPINIKIQLCIALTCITSCLSRENGSRRAFFLLWFIYDNIDKKNTDDIVMKFILFSKKPEYRRNIDSTNFKVYLIISAYIFIYYKYMIDKQSSCFVDFRSETELLNNVRKLQKYIIYGSIIKTSSLLFYLHKNNDANNINWISTCIQEARNADNIKKYDMSIRFLPLLFAACVYYSQTNTMNIPFISSIIDISCSIICCDYQYTDKSSSDYDKLLVASKITDFYTLIKEGMEEDLVGFTNLKKIISDVKRTPRSNDFYSREYNNLIVNIYAIIKKMHEDALEIQAFSEEKPKEITHDKKIEIPSLSIFFENNCKKYSNLIGGQIVYYVDRKVMVNDLKKNGMCQFFCEINQDIDNNIKKGSTMLIYGPIARDDLVGKNVEKRNQFSDVTISNFPMNYYLNNMKVKYGFDEIGHIDFFNFLHIDLGNLIKDNDDDSVYQKVCERDKKVEKSFCMNQNIMNFFYLVHKYHDIKSKYWLVMNDPFSDYRLKTWNIECMITENEMYTYYYMTKSSRFTFVNGVSVDFDIRTIFSLYILMNDGFYGEIIRRYYMVQLYKALFGIEGNSMENSIVSDFFIHINTKKKTVSLSFLPHARFTQPKYVPYDYDKRLHIGSVYNPNTQKRYIKPTSSSIPSKVLSDPKQDKKDFFFREFPRTLNVIKLLYYFYKLETETMTKQDAFDFPQNIKNDIKKLYIFKQPIATTNSKRNLHSKYSIVKTQTCENKCIFGCMTFFVAKILGLDVNIFGFDPEFAYFILSHKKNLPSTLPNFSIYKPWIWSIIERTSILSENEPNDNLRSYRECPPIMKLRLSIDHFKGWILRDHNTDMVIRTMENWKGNLMQEQEYLKDVIEHPKKSDYNRFYNPDPRWLYHEWMPEIINAHTKTIETYKKMLEGDLWDFCEFMFGELFIHNYLTHINKLLQRVIIKQGQCVKLRNKSFVSHVRD